MAEVTKLTRIAGLFEGAPYAYGAVVPPGARTVFLAGACPLDADGRTIAAGDVTGQAPACLQNMERALAAAGADVGDVVFVRALVASSDREELARVWEVVRDRFGGRPPPGTLMGVAALGWPQQLVEIEAIAAVVE